METYMVHIMQLLGLIAGIIVSCGVIWKVAGRPLRFVYMHLFGEPVGAWARAQVGAVVDEKLLKRNGGTTVPDVVNRVELLEKTVRDSQAEHRQMHAENSERFDKIEIQLKEAS